MKELILVRHGETDFNAQRRYQGAIDTDLSDQGRTQAQRLTGELKEMPFDVLVSSPLKRAIQTAEFIARAFDMPIDVREAFSERNLGVFEGLTGEEAETRYAGLWKRIVTKHLFDAPDGGESLAECTYRVWRGIDRLICDYAEKRVLVVTHAAVARVVRGRFVRMTNDENFSYLLHNGEWVSYSLNEEKSGSGENPVRMAVPVELIEAYEATTYVIHARDGHISFRAGQVNGEIDGLLAASGATEWVFMTAWNPLSKRTEDMRNRERQEVLAKSLSLGGFEFLPGEGIGDGGDWPNEPALFIPGMEREKGLAFGRAFEQYAVIHGRIGAAPEILYC